MTTRNRTNGIAILGGLTATLAIGAGPARADHFSVGYSSCGGSGSVRYYGGHYAPAPIVTYAPTRVVTYAPAPRYAYHRSYYRPVRYVSPVHRRPVAYHRPVRRVVTYGDRPFTVRAHRHGYAPRHGGLTVRFRR